MSTTSGLIDRQHELFASISRTIVNLRKRGEANITEAYVKSRTSALKDIWAAFQRNHAEITAQKTEILRKDSYFTEDLWSQCEEAVIDNQATLEEYLERLRRENKTSQASDIAGPNPFEQQGHPARALPPIGLPKFSGLYKEWTSFRDLFQSLVIDKANIPEVEKLHYLKMSVTSEAAQLICNLTVTGDNFKLAWKVLSDRYENRRVLVDTQLDLLFSLKRSTRESAVELKRIYGTTNEVVGALNGLRCDTKQWDAIVVYWVSRKFDPDTFRSWEMHIASSTELPSLSQLNDFMLMHIRALESMERFSASSTASSRTREQRVHSHQVSVHGNACPACNAIHILSSCQSYLAKSVEQRKAFVAERRLCFNCLGSHQRKFCPSKKRCTTCKARHHSSLHGSSNIVGPSTASAFSSVESSSNSDHPSAAASSHHVANRDSSSQHRRRMLLATALVKVTSSQGRSCVVRALLDQGSEISFVSEAVVQQLRLPRQSVLLPVSSIGAEETLVARGASTLTIESLTDSTFNCEVNAFILPKLTTYIADLGSQLASMPHLLGLTLADPEYAKPKRSDLVLGVEVYSSILLPGMIRGPPRTPIAQNTHLGWMVSGPIQTREGSLSSGVTNSLQCSVDQELVDLLQRFWEQEDYASNRAPSLSEAELVCENHFVQTHTRDADGRYTVRLPLVRDVLALGDSRTAALRMLLSTEARAAKHPQLHSAYTQFLEEYERLGHMRRATVQDRRAHPSVYLPHHGILRETSSTTKLRVVFNGSYRTTSGLSLNDCLYSGPKLQNDLADVLLRWRRYAYAFSADVEKMYRQIRVHPDDQALQRILWRRDTSGPVVEYLLTTVTYGLACAPYLALRCVRQLVQDSGEKLPLATTALRDETYVDDVLSGAHNLADGIEKIRQISELLGAGGFQLHKWTSNDDRLLANLPVASADARIERSVHTDTHQRALGIAWHVHRDAFVFTFGDITYSNPTKRNVLSTVSQLFDPLGWIAPVVVQGKILMQELWAIKIGWDDLLPSDFVQRWEGFVSGLRELTALTIPRWIGTSPSNIATEIHGFADASALAMGTAVYLRTHHDDETIQTSLILAKSRVAPLKRVTIPRLELSAAVILARSVKRIRQTLGLTNTPVHLWTDSTVALAWIRSHPSRWKEFVQNRVTEIQTLVPDATWHHVPGLQNPADLSSRGMAPRHLANTPLWWAGPSWLQSPSPSWPAETLSPDERIDVEQRKGPSALVALSTTLTPTFDLADRYSSLVRLCRITAWCFRATRRLRKNSSRPAAASSLSVDEIDHALVFWIKYTQSSHFSEEIKTISSRTALSKGSQLYKLTPYLDPRGLLRVGGRLQHSLLHPDQQHPYILPRKASLTTLVIDQAHKQAFHAGPQLTLATIRQTYWIVGGRCPVRLFINNCVVCARQRARTCEQVIGQLPARRVTPSKAFFHSGVDYAGPVTVKTMRGRGGRTHKGYIAVFVCLAIGAVHLELVSDYTTDAFIAAYKRFSGRRGIPSSITSDCGTNLVGADRELRRMFNSASRESHQIVTALANDCTQWRFNPPAAPHFGGRWEAAVKSVKFHLRRILGDTALTFEEFATVLVQVEAVLNSRPLCPITDDPSDLTALTPGHFLVGHALTVVPEPTLSHVPSSRLSRWQLLRQSVEHFWNRWSREYLSSLQTASKWLRQREDVKVGALVIVKDDNSPPSKWPLARVTQVHPGQDGHTRVVTVRTAATTLKRPITKICVLPIDTSETALRNHCDSNCKTGPPPQPPNPLS